MLLHDYRQFSELFLQTRHITVYALEIISEDHIHIMHFSFIMLQIKIVKWR